MNISHEPGDGTTDVMLELYDPLPLEWARCPSAAIYRRVEGGRIVVVKERGKVLEC
jgi:hypothetical protein